MSTFARRCFILPPLGSAGHLETVRRVAEEATRVREECAEQMRQHFTTVVHRLEAKRSETLAFQAALAEERSRKEQLLKSAQRMDLERARYDRADRIKHNQAMVSMMRASRPLVRPPSPEHARTLPPSLVSGCVEMVLLWERRLSTLTLCVFPCFCSQCRESR